MVHKIIGTNIFIQTSQAGINLFNAQEKDIQEYSEILNYIIVLNRKLSNSIESASKESEKRSCRIIESCKTDMLFGFLIF